MKKLIPIFVILVVTSFSCKKDKPRPSTIYISGTVTDKLTTNPLDSVNTSLNYSTGSIGSPLIPQTTIYTGTNGKFNFQFSPKENYSYQLFFDKTGSGYKWQSKSIDLTKENQIFNIVLEK